MIYILSFPMTPIIYNPSPPESTHNYIVQAYTATATSEQYYVFTITIKLYIKIAKASYRMCLQR